MSLDICLSQKGAVRGEHSGIFIREDGSMREISREEWDSKFPGREPVTATIPDCEADEEVFWANITHNLTGMASAAGIYDCLWRPDENGITTARQMIEPLEAGLAKLKAAPEEFRKHDAPNGWGTYESFLPFVENVLNGCREYPEAEVRACR